MRLAGASLAEIAAAAAASGPACRQPGARATRPCWGPRSAYARILAGGVTTLEVKSGYGLTAESELHQLGLLERSRSATPMSLVITFLGAHVVPADRDADAYTGEVLEMLDRVIEQGIASFHDITCERGLFTPAQARLLFERSRELAIPTKAHADAWAASEGWRTAVAGGAVSAEHLTYTPDEEIREVRRDRHDSRPAAAGRAGVHDRPARKRATADRARGAGSRSRPTTAPRSTPHRWPRRSGWPRRGSA